MSDGLHGEQAREITALGACGVLERRPAPPQPAPGPDPNATIHPPVAIRPGYGGGGTTGRHTLAPGSHQLPGPQSVGWAELTPGDTAVTYAMGAKATATTPATRRTNMLIESPPIGNVQAFSRALSHAGLMSGARADPLAGTRL